MGDRNQPCHRRCIKVRYLDTAWEDHYYSRFVLRDTLLLNKDLGCFSATASIKIIILELGGEGWRPRDVPLGWQIEVPLPGPDGRR